MNKSSDRSFGLVFAGFFTVLGGVALWNNPRGETCLWMFAIATVFLVLALFWTAPLKPLNIVWLKFGEILHKIASPIVMMGMYVFTIVPIGMLLRLFGKDLLRMKLRPDEPTYWIRRDTNETPESDMSQQF